MAMSIINCSADAFPSLLPDAVSLRWQLFGRTNLATPPCGHAGGKNARFFLVELTIYHF